MICKVQKTIERFSMLDGAKSVAIGLSGGADSVCLFDILKKLSAGYGFKLVAVHVNHNLRGSEALRDLHFVEQLCADNDVELKLFSYSVAETAEKEKIGVEECGRKLRYEAFQSVGCDKIAVAHSLSDCIETTVFNLVRGSSLSGVCRIPPTRGKIIRPLIDCTAEEIRDYCRENALSFVVDSTNLHDDYSRNYIRNNIVPLFSKLNPDFEKSFCRFYDSVERDNTFISKKAKELLRVTTVNENEFKRNAFLSVDEAVFYRTVRLMLENKMKKQVEKRHIDLAAEIIMNEGTLQLSGDLFISADRDIIFFHSPTDNAKPWSVNEEDGVFVSPYKKYSLLISEPNESSSFRGGNTCDAALLKEPLLMRSRREKDSLKLPKRGVTKTLKKLFNEKKIPPEKRNRIAVLESNGEIVWVEGFGVNAPFAVSENTKKNVTIISKEG